MVAFFVLTFFSVVGRASPDSVNSAGAFALSGLPTFGMVGKAHHIKSALGKTHSGSGLQMAERSCGAAWLLRHQPLYNHGVHFTWASALHSLE